MKQSDKIFIYSGIGLVSILGMNIINSFYIQTALVVTGGIMVVMIMREMGLIKKGVTQ